MDLEPRLLRYFVAVAEELSFSRAAQRLHISQPPLSYAIKQLERTIDTQLLKRTSRHIELTRAGSALYNEALFLLKKNADIVKLVQRIDAGLQGQVKIGFTASMLHQRLPETLKLFQQYCPNIEHVLFEAHSAEQISLIERGGLDFGFIHSNPTPQSIAKLDLISEPFCICLPAAHPLAHKDTLDLSMLMHEEFIFFPRSFSPGYYQIIVAMCLNAGFLPTVKHEVRHWLSVIALVSQGMGVSIVPASLSHYALWGLRFIPFEHSQRSISSLIWSPAPASTIKHQHVELIRSVYSL
jgi:DNA-binding transcriptional LysR family regulator